MMPVELSQVPQEGGDLHLSVGLGQPLPMHGQRLVYDNHQLQALGQNVLPSAHASHLHAYALPYLPIDSAVAHIEQQQLPQQQHAVKRPRHDEGNGNQVVRARLQLTAKVGYLVRTAQQILVTSGTRMTLRLVESEGKDMPVPNAQFLTHVMEHLCTFPCPPWQLWAGKSIKEVGKSAYSKTQVNTQKASVCLPMGVAERNNFETLMRRTLKKLHDACQDIFDDDDDDEGNNLADEKMSNHFTGFFIVGILQAYRDLNAAMAYSQAPFAMAPAGVVIPAPQLSHNNLEFPVPHLGPSVDSMQTASLPATAVAQVRKQRSLKKDRICSIQPPDGFGSEAELWASLTSRGRHETRHASKEAVAQIICDFAWNMLDYLNLQIQLNEHLSGNRARIRLCMEVLNQIATFNNPGINEDAEKRVLKEWRRREKTSPSRGGMAET